MSRPTLPLNGQIRAEATEWLLRFSEGEVDVASRSEFYHWLRSSPEHVRAYLRVFAFWQEADCIGGKPICRDIDALVQLAAHEANVIPLELGGRDLTSPTARAEIPREGTSEDPPASSAIQSAGRHRFRLALAAAALLTVGAAIVGFSRYRVPVYTTGVGEQRSVTLPDGSVVTLNASSSIRLAYLDTQRVIELRGGQALFKVAPQLDRPFVVQSRGTRIRALGTQFDVDLKDTGTVVTVIEGRVSVSAAAISPPLRLAHVAAQSTPTLLSAGEQALVTSGSARKAAKPQVQAATAWTVGLMVFDGAPLKEVVREFNRQNIKPLVISDADLSDLKITGTFPASGSERIVRFLEERFDVAVHETDGNIEISRR